MIQNSYDQMTHDEILRIHGDAYSHMTPEQKLRAAVEAKERLRRYSAEQKQLAAEREELDSPRNKKLSEITLGEIMDELGKVADQFLKRLALGIVAYLFIVWIAKYLGWTH